MELKEIVALFAGKAVKMPVQNCFLVVIVDVNCLALELFGFDLSYITIKNQLMVNGLLKQ